MSSLSYSLKQTEEPMDTSDAVKDQPTVVAAQAPPPVLPKPSSPPRMSSVETLVSQQTATHQRQAPREPQMSGLQTMVKGPLPGAVQVLPMAPGGQAALSAPKISPPKMPKPSGTSSRPPTFLTHLKGAEINEGDRFGFFFSPAQLPFCFVLHVCSSLLVDTAFTVRSTAHQSSRSHGSKMAYRSRAPTMSRG